jgi:hypothetical protein
MIRTHEIFSRATFSAGEILNLYEEVHKNCLFHCGDRDLRDCAGRGPAVVQDDRQELPYE